MQPIKITPTVKAAITRMKRGQRGVTLNKNGTVFKGKSGDVVTFLSRNVRVDRLSPLMIVRFASLIGRPWNGPIKIGLFRLQKRKGFVSIDANVIRSRKARGESLRIARRHKQESIFDLKKRQVVLT